MPILDWTLTDLRRQLHHGDICMRFGYVDFALFDIFLLERGGALEDYSEHIYAALEASGLEVLCNTRVYLFFECLKAARVVKGWGHNKITFLAVHSSHPAALFVG